MNADRDQIRAIFAQALKLPQADRAALLDQACAADAAMRAELESLLSAADEAAGFMVTPESPGGASETKLAGESMLVPILEKPGAVIGRYRLLQQIGEGGFGVVFMAEQREPVQRKVALKIIKLGMDTKSVIARFEAERQALALMDHPNVARVFDGGVTGVSAAPGTPSPSQGEGWGEGVSPGRPYFVMEYVRGDPITDFADAHKLGVRDRLDLFMQVCAAVQHAHQKGVIHRDIKPRNVLVSMVDGRPHAKVIDFGIAKATGARLTDKTLFTEHRQLIGTPEYMSPEQAEGSPDIDTRTDVYALGVLLYELLTGVTPFDARRLRSAAFAEMQRIIREEEPPAPSLRILKPPLAPVGRISNSPSVTSGLRAHEQEGVGQVSNPSEVVRVSNPQEVGPQSEPRPAGSGPESEPRPEGRGLAPDPTSHLAALAAARQCDPTRLGALFRGELDWIVMKALDKDRARRYESPNQLAADIHRHLAGEPVVAAPPSMGYRFRKFARKHRAGVVAASLVAVVLGLGISGTTLGWRAAGNAKQALRAESMRTRLAETATKLAALQSQGSRRTSDDKQILREIVSVREELLGKSHRDTILALFKLGHAVYWLHSADEGLAILRDAINRFLASGEPFDEWMIEEFAKTADLSMFNLDLDESERLHERVAWALAEFISKNGREPLKSISPRIFGAWNSEWVNDIELRFASLTGERFRQQAIRFVENHESPGVSRLIAESSPPHYSALLTRNIGRWQHFVLREPSNTVFRRAVAIGHYRLAQYPEALAALDNLSYLYAKEGKGDRPINLALTAMTHFKLGDADKARAALAQLRALLSDPAAVDTWAKDDEATAIFKEAEDLIEGPLPTSAPASSLAPQSSSGP